MKYLFDTDILIYWLKGNQVIERKAVAIGLENIGYSIISLAELYFGAYNSEQIDNVTSDSKRTTKINAF